MIKRIINSEAAVAHQIYDLFQAAYQVEAEIIGVTKFPPLLRSKANIMASKTCFTGYLEEQTLLGVIETAFNKQCLEIHSLVVKPDFFGRGIAKHLMQHVSDSHQFEKAIVETALANVPAIMLYKKLGFIEYNRWVPAHGIEKVAMQKIAAKKKD